MRKANIIASVIIILLCGLLFTQVNAIRETGLEAIGPRFFPTAVLCLIIALSIIVLGASVKSKEVNDEKFITKAQSIRVLVTFILFTFYILGLKYIGFIISTIVFLFASTSFFYGKVDKGLINLSIFSVVATIIIYLLFNNFFGIILP